MSDFYCGKFFLRVFHEIEEYFVHSEKKNGLLNGHIPLINTENMKITFGPKFGPSYPLSNIPFFLLSNIPIMFKLMTFAGSEPSIKESPSKFSTVKKKCDFTKFCRRRNFSITMNPHRYFVPYGCRRLRLVSGLLEH